MKITCPQCHFEREININKIPTRSTVATCPKCGIKFAFRSLTPEKQSEVANDKLEAFKEINHNEEQSNISQTSPEHIKTEDNNDYKNENIESKEENSLEVKPADTTEISDDNEEKPANITENHDYSDDARQKSKTPSEEEEEKIKQAHAFYREQMNKIKELEKEGYSIQLMTMVPWEDAQSNTNIFEKFFQTVIRSLFASPAFFTTMLRPFPISKAVLFYIIIGIIQFIARMLTFRYNADPSVTIEDPNIQLLMDTLLDPSTLVLGLFIAPFVLILQLMFVSGILTFIVKLVEPRTGDFQLIVRVLCYASAPGLLSVVPILGDLLAMPWILFNVVIALRCALNLTLAKTMLTVFALILFIFLALLAMLSVF